jgi:hypothetical protein
VAESDSDGLIVGATVDAIDMVLLLSFPFDEAMLAVLV